MAGLVGEGSASRGATLFLLPGFRSKLKRMNEIAPNARGLATTQAAEGLPRYKWSLAEFERLSELGFFGGIDRERKRVELVGGELVPMNAKGARHETVRGRLQKHLQLQLGIDFDVLGEPGWRPGEDVYCEPDILVCPSGLPVTTVPPADVLLLIEVADTSLAYDTGVKARLYAGLGVREYWVVNAATLETLVHREPGPEGYGAVVTVPHTATLVPHLLPALGLSLGGLAIA